MRFLSSSALAKAAKFRLETSCSAAETITELSSLATLPSEVYGRSRHF
jgi:hypothetical protein